MARKRNIKYYLLIPAMVFCTSIHVSALVAGAQPNKPFEFKRHEFQPVRPEPRPLFSQIDHGDVTVSPPVITLRYGNRVVTLSQGGHGTVNIPEDSSLVDAQGRVTVTLEYTLRNNTTKNFKFNVLLRYGNNSVASTPVTLYSHATKTINQTVRLQSTRGEEQLRIQGPVGISDDTHIIFFGAGLRVRVYAL